MDHPTQRLLAGKTPTPTDLNKKLSIVQMCIIPINVYTGLNIALKFPLDVSYFYISLMCQGQTPSRTFHHCHGQAKRALGASGAWIPDPPPPPPLKNSSNKP